MASTGGRRGSLHVIAPSSSSTGALIELLVAWNNGSLSLTVEELIADAAALISGTGQATWRC
jgi:hypothetical protein